MEETITPEVEAPTPAVEPVVKDGSTAVTLQDKLMYLTVGVQKVVSRLGQFKNQTGKSNNADYGCAELFNAIDELNYCLGEPGAQHFMVGYDLLVNLLGAVTTLQQAILDSADPEILKALQQSIEIAAKAAREHLGVPNPRAARQAVAPQLVLQPGDSEKL